MIPPNRSRQEDFPAALRTLYAVAAACFLSGPGLSADEGLSSVIRNVEDNEGLYQNLDARIRTHYDIGDRPPQNLGGGKEIVRKEVDTHFVSQDGLFRLETMGGEFDAEQGQSTRDKVRLFGGERTKLLVGKAVGNLIAGRAEDDEFVRPHTLLVRYSSVPVPLSVYLRGHAAIAASAGDNWLQNLELVITYGGEDEFEGLKCHKVVVATILPGSDDPELTTAELWLAERRNYLPIRMLLWDLKRSTEIPRVDGFVSEMRELKPGIWFPISAQVTSYEPFALQSAGKQQMGWREEYFVESASLEPQYDLAYFNDLEFPDGAAVYEVENREIKKAYRIGAPETPAGPPAAGVRLWWLLWGNLAVGAVVVGAVVWRRRRALKSAASGPRGAVA